MRKLQLLAFFVASVLGMSAAPISPEQALSRLSATGPAKAPALSSANLSLKYTVLQKNEMAAAYVFTPENGVGFTVLSADDMAVPVYGYSDSEIFDANNIPPALEWWLNQLSSRVNHAAGQGLDAEGTYAYAPEDMGPISPIVKTKWNQNKPFNDMTPVMNGRQTYTGCVATSFAQVMKYFNYPQRGKGNVTYYDSGTRRVMNFTKDFQWDNMLNTYTDGNYTDEQAEAVAYLMKACGYTVQMNYGLTGSGALSHLVAEAAVKYFNYDVDITYADRMYYTLDDWSRMIYDNIKNIGPVIYNGLEMAGGHSFICDGYDGKGYFHFNWGWGGMSDGYYLLDALNPATQGIGASEGGFNFKQDVILGLQPPVEGSKAPYAKMRLFGSLTASLRGNSIIFDAVGDADYIGYASMATRDATFGIGAIFSKIGDPDSEIAVGGYVEISGDRTVESLSLTPTTYLGSDNARPVVEIPALPDGDYKVTFASIDLDMEDSPFIPILYVIGDINYCYLSINNGVYTVTSVSPSKISYNSAGFTTPLYLNKNTRLAINATNDSDLQLSQSYYPALFRNGRMQYRGDYMLITIDPNTTTTIEVFTKFYEAANATATGYGTYELALIDSETNRPIGMFEEAEMTSAPTKLTVTLNEFGIEGANQQKVTVGSRTFDDVFIITDSNEMDVILDYTVVEGYFDTSLRLIGAEYNPDTNKFDQLIEDVYSERPFTSEGSAIMLTIPVNLKEYESGVVYRLIAGYVEGNANRTLGTLYFQFDTSGVESIDDDSDAEAVYFNLQGVRINNPEPGQLLIRRKGNVSEKIIF